VVVGWAGRAGLRFVYPGEPGSSNRFEQGSAELPATSRFALPWLGLPSSRLLVLATPATPASMPRLFGAGPSEGGPARDTGALRLRGQLRAEPGPQAYAALLRWPGP
jgi:hypothetical protein